MANPVTDEPEVSLYDGEGDVLLPADKRSDCLIILPSGDHHPALGRPPPRQQGP
ncbi:MAG: hypothetical protein ACYTEY_01900 [Planctomycetota bacterium]